MKKLVFVVLAICGLAFSVVNAWEYDSRKREKMTPDPQSRAKMLVDGYEEFKAKYPKTYKAYFDDDYDSEYYVDIVSDRLDSPFSVLTRGKSVRITYKSLEKGTNEIYGKIYNKAEFLKNGMTIDSADSAFGELDLVFDYVKAYKEHREKYR